MGERRRERKNEAVPSEKKGVSAKKPDPVLLCSIMYTLGFPPALKALTWLKLFGPLQPPF